MRFFAEKSTLQVALASALEATGKGQHSVLQTVLLTLAGNTLSLDATDVKTYLHTSIEVDGQEDGSVAVFCDKLTAILSGLPAGMVSIEYKDNNIILKPDSKKATYKIPTMAAQSFPEKPVIGDAKSFEIAGSELVRMIGKVAHAVSADETRWFMNGLYFTTDQGNLRMVATDGRRLALCDSDIQCNDFNIIVPIRPLQLITKHAGAVETITVQVSDKHINFVFGNSEISSVLIEGQFPNYTKVIPQGYTDKLTVDKTDFMQAVKRVSVLSDGKSQKMRFELKENSLTVSTEGTDAGEASEELKATASTERLFFLNYGYVIDALKSADDSAVIEYGESSKPVVIKEANSLQIIMPMQAD